jgi:hypothetical protein
MEPTDSSPLLAKENLTEDPMCTPVDYSAIWSYVKESAAPLVTLLASFSGAWFAFRLQSKHKLTEVRNSNIAAANQAFFILLQQLNTIKLIQKDFIDPFRDRVDAFIVMQPLYPEDHAEMKFDFTALGFLLSTRHKQLLLDIWLEQKRFDEAIKIFNYRSRLHYERVQPKFAQGGIQAETVYPNSVFREVLGPQLYEELERATQQAIMHIDRTLNSLDALRVKLEIGFKDLFPEGDFLKIAIL